MIDRLFYQELICTIKKDKNEIAKLKSKNKRLNNKRHELIDYLRKK